MEGPLVSGSVYIGSYVRKPLRKLSSESVDETTG